MRVDILCQGGELPNGIEGASAMWALNSYLTPTIISSGEYFLGTGSRRRLRSRSSPVRSRVSLKQKRPRSPSASVLQQEPVNDVMLDPLFDKLNDDTPTQITKQACCSAFFSPTPPDSPLWLVPVGPTTPPKIRSSRVRTPVDNQSQRKHRSKSSRVVKSLIHDLISTLNLPEPREQRSKTTVAIDCYTRNDVEPPPPSPLKTKLNDCRSIAIQAHLQRKNAGNSKLPASNSELHAVIGSNRSEVEWLGSVRALRDSHVRLVLRQLRHIERLNRALDRVNVPYQPTPISAAK